MSTQDIQFNKNEDLNKQEWDLAKSRLEKIYGGGGEKAAAKQKEKGKCFVGSVLTTCATQILSG